MTDRQLHNEVKEYEGFLDLVAPIDQEARDTELEYLSGIEKEVKKELGVSK